MKPWIWLRSSVTAILMTIALIAVFDRRASVETLSIRFVSGPVVAGERVIVQWTVKELRGAWGGGSCGGLIYPRWIDSSGAVSDNSLQPDAIPFREFRGSEPQTFQRPRLVPPELMPGEATFAPWTIRWCNPLQKWIWPMRDELPKVHFTVSPKS